MSELNDNRPTVYLVDDDALVRHGLRTLLDVSGYAVEDFSSGEALLARNPAGLGCILLDVCMNGMNGLEVQQALSARGNPLPVIFLTAFGDAPRIVQAVKDGAEDFLIKPVDGALLVDRIRQALEDYAPRMLSEQGRMDFMRRMDALTEREREVLTLSVEGMSCKDIGVRLGLSHRTVELHRSHICTKMGAAKFSELFHLAARLGLTFI